MVLELRGERADFNKGIEYLTTTGLIMVTLSREVTRNEDRCTDCGACVTVSRPALLVLTQLLVKSLSMKRNAWSAECASFPARPVRWSCISKNLSFLAFDRRWIKGDKIYQPRTYRSQQTSPDLVSFTVSVKETNLFVSAKVDLERKTHRLTLKYRSILEKYIADIRFSDLPYTVGLESDAPLIVETWRKPRQSRCGPWFQWPVHCPVHRQRTARVFFGHHHRERR